MDENTGEGRYLLSSYDGHHISIQFNDGGKIREEIWIKTTCPNCKQETAFVFNQLVICPSCHYGESDDYDTKIRLRSFENYGRLIV